MHSEQYSAYPQQQVQSPSDTRGEYTDYRGRVQQHMTSSRQQLQQQQQQQPEPRIIDRRYGSSLALPPRESSSHSRSGSHSSASSMDVDEMIIKASTADEVAAANSGAAGYPPQYQHLQSQQHPGVQAAGSLPVSSPHRRARGLERDRERGDGSPRPNTSPPVPTSNNPYPPSYPASQSAPGSMRNVAGSSSGSQVLLTTHVFAPVVTGAPTKKTKFPNTPGVGEFPIFLLCRNVFLFVFSFLFLNSFWFENSPLCHVSSRSFFFSLAPPWLLVRSLTRWSRMPAFADRSFVRLFGDWVTVRDYA